MEQDHMLQEQPPSYSQSHDPQSLELPSVPPADPPPIHHERTLPPLPSAPAEPRFRAEEHQFVWPSSNPLTAYYQPGPSQLSPKNSSAIGVDSPGTMDLDISDSRGRRGGSVFSIDDPDVRLAAEALGDLRAGMFSLKVILRSTLANSGADFIQSPPQHHNSLPTSAPQNQPRGANPEPLLSLLTTSHPLIGTAIGGSLSAYSASKNYSPRFKSSAEYVERRFTPVVNTVGSVGRITGVEDGVRWFLGEKKNHPSETDDSREGSNKRRKVDQEPDHYRQRNPSQASTADSLPAYDDIRSPSYEAALVPTKSNSNDEFQSPSSWQSRLVLSTSGLSVAMSDESLRSLKYCLSWLRWANEHIGKVILSLKSVLQQYEQSAITNPEHKDQERQLIVRTQDRTLLNAQVATLKSDVLKTLKEVVDIVSKYAGGALPDNARVLVRRHLTSLPQRFKVASDKTGEDEGGDKEVDGAKRVLVLAGEGLDMMAQVSGVVGGTIESAEEWCERLGRRRGEDGGEMGGREEEKRRVGGSEGYGGDVKMG